MAEVIAELATNHGGDMELAARMIADAKRCGADYAKVQAYQTKFLRPDDPQADWFRRCELSDENLRWLKGVCDTEGIKFLATVYGPERVALIRELSDEVKIGSGEARDTDLLRAVELARFQRTFIGCGIDTPLICPAPDTVPMFGVSDYPATIDSALLTIADATAYEPVGYSDHTRGVCAAEFALACDAAVIELHVALAGTAPRLPCDKTRQQTTVLCRYAKHGPRLRAELKAIRDRSRLRFVGRWAHGR
jgi:sialic acid synthase SpsE